MGILRVRHVLLDTSILANIARDMFGSVLAGREKAKRCWTYLQEQGWLPVLVCEQIIELLAHHNDDVVDTRIRLLTELPLFASPCGGAERGPVAIAANILSLEAEAIITKSLTDAQSVREEVRPRLFSSFDGLTLQKWISRDLAQLKERAREHSMESRELASLGRIRYADGNTNICSKSRQGDIDLSSHEAWIRKQTLRELHEHGDRRLNNHNQIASEWSERIRDGLEGVVAQEDPHEALLQSFGIPPESVQSDTSLDEVGELAIYANNLRIVSDCLGLTHPLTIRDVPPELCPSWILRRGIASISRRAQHVAGSDILDSFLMALLPYADVVVADKRTVAYCQQFLSKSPELTEVVNSVVKVGDYADLPRVIAEALQ